MLIALARFIEYSGFAHGDIHPSNIIVNNEGKGLKFIDYDGIYVKDIKELGNCECGTPNFQHSQCGNAWNSKLDRFSFVCLYAALNTLIERYSLQEELLCYEESILFIASDCEDIKFYKLMEIENIAEDAQKFKRICETSFDKILSLDDCIAGMSICYYCHTSKLVYFASVVYFQENGYMIKQLDDLHARLSNDNDIRLLSAVSYAISGYDDVKLLTLTALLKAKKMKI